MAVLGVSSITPAFPGIGRALGISPRRQIKGFGATSS